MVMSATKREATAPSRTLTSFFQPQKIIKTGQSTFSSQTVKTNFDKKLWTDKLTPNQRELLELEITTLDDSWLGALHEELTKPYFLALKQFLADEKKKKTVVFPPENDIYSWSRLTPLHDVKVIILGQDPYHNYNQAHGLAFSVNPPTPPPPSLKNMYKGIANDYTDFKVPKTGSLIPWAQQGVLLLNACLTVRAHNANSHAGRGWETFTEKVLEAAIKSRPSGVVFLAWGSPAAKRVDKIGPGKQHLVLKTVHPSPLSAARGFFTAGHFRKANEWLLKVYGPQGLINWALEKGNIITDIQRCIGEATVLKEEMTESLCNAVNDGKTESLGPQDSIETNAVEIVSTTVASSQASLLDADSDEDEDNELLALADASENGSSQVQAQTEDKS